MLWARGNCRSREAAAHVDGRVWVEAELKDVGDQALMRGLVTAFPIVRPGLFLSYCGRRSFASHKAVDGCSPAVVPPPPMREVQVRCGDLRFDRLRLPCNSPHESGQLSGNGGANHCRPLSSCGQHTIASRQPALRLPRDLSYFRWRFLQAV